MSLSVLSYYGSAGQINSQSRQRSSGDGGLSARTSGGQDGLSKVNCQIMVTETIG